MNILIVGNGAREHAIAWKLRGSSKVDIIYVAPGNAGTASVGVNLPVSPEELQGLSKQVKAHSIDLVIVGPEVPLANGIVDLFCEIGIHIFGPTKAASQLESSKAFAKQLMEAHDVPCPGFKVFHSYAQAQAFLSTHQGAVVVKADGLAAGKGAFVCANREEALQALHECMEARTLGSAGDRVVIEEYLEGWEVSVFGFSDGEHLSPLIAACDYKRLIDGDDGPNTGGMGSYTPPESWTSELATKVEREIMEPVIKALAEAGTPYKGVLYAGLMITTEGPQVLEFNCRFGDPEAQVILPLLKTDLTDIVLASIGGEMDNLPIQWREEACVGVVMASGGYPGTYTTGYPIVGLDTLDQDALVFHAGTRLADGEEDGIVLTQGGRVLTVVGRGQTLATARTMAYDNVQRMGFQDAHYRTDIALQRERVNL